MGWRPMMRPGKVLVGVALWFLMAAFPGVWVSAQGPNQGGLVIVSEDGQVETYCLDFAEDELTGADLLALSGLDVVIDPSSGMGPIVCRIASVGCAYPSEACFCQCTGGGGCTYWNYFYRDPDDGTLAPKWMYSALGAAVRKVRPGAVDAWVWGDGRTPPAEELDFETVCALPTATPEASPQVLVTATAVATRIEPSAEDPTEAPTTAPTQPIEETLTAEGPAETATPEPPATEIVANPTLATESGQALADYWPFGLMLVGLAVVGFLVWLRGR